MSKKVINISKRKLNLGNITLDTLKPIVLKDSELTTLVQKTLDGYVNLGFVKVFDVKEQPLLFTQTEEYKKEVENKEKQTKEIQIENTVKKEETETQIETENTEDKKATKSYTKKKQSKKQEEEK